MSKPAKTIHNNQNGAIFALLMLGLVVFGLMYLVGQSLPDPSSIKNSEGSDEASLAQPDQQTEDSSISRKTITLSALDGLEGSGKAIREIESGKLTIELSAVLPELLDDGYFEAYLSNGNERILLGRPTKLSATYKLSYEITSFYETYNQISVVVDGPRDLKNQARQLPFNILEGSFSP